MAPVSSTKAIGNLILILSIASLIAIAFLFISFSHDIRLHHEENIRLNYWSSIGAFDV